MAEMAPIVSHSFTSLASGCSRSPPPVVFLYSLKAASRTELRSEGGVLGVWIAVGEDMVLATVRFVGDGSRVERKTRGLSNLVGRVCPGTGLMNFNER